jgi:putative cell wall-binding protein
MNESDENPRVEEIQSSNMIVKSNRYETMAFRHEGNETKIMEMSDEEEEMKSIEDVFHDAIGEIQMGSARLNESLRGKDTEFKSSID